MKDDEKDLVIKQLRARLDEAFLEIQRLNIIVSELEDVLLLKVKRIAYDDQKFREMGFLILPIEGVVH